MADDILDYELLGGIYRRRFESAVLIKRKAARIFDFFGLPREIRNMIYTNLYVPVEIPIVKQVCKLESARLEVAPIKSLLLINRQFKQEYCEELPLQPEYHEFIVQKEHEHDQEPESGNTDVTPVSRQQAFKVLNQQSRFAVDNLFKRLNKVTELTFRLHAEKRAGLRCFTTRDSIYVLRKSFLGGLENISLYMAYDEEDYPQHALSASMLASYSHFLFNDPITKDYPLDINVTPNIQTSIHRFEMPIPSLRHSYKDWTDADYRRLSSMVWSCTASRIRFVSKLPSAGENPEYLFNGLSYCLEEQSEDCGSNWTFDDLQSWIIGLLD